VIPFPTVRAGRDPVGHVNTFAFSPDGRTLVTGEGDGTIRFWDTNTWQKIGGSVTAATETVLTVAFDPTGTMLLTAGDDSSVRLFDVASRTEIGQALPGIAGPPAFSRRSPPMDVTSSPATLRTSTGDDDGSHPLRDDGYVLPPVSTLWRSQCAGSDRRVSL
jgi:WD40 repeat protein